MANLIAELAGSSRDTPVNLEWDLPRRTALVLDKDRRMSCLASLCESA
jgi:hypothetical protein